MTIEERTALLGVLAALLGVLATVVGVPSLLDRKERRHQHDRRGFAQVGLEEAAGVDAEGVARRLDEQVVHPLL